MKASDLLLACLAAHGVDRIFGVPGEENADVMLSLPDSTVDFVVTVHEQTAAFMADMHGRLTGTPGVCLATLGPGATNLMTAVAQANEDHSPLIAIVGQADRGRLHKPSHQNIDLVEMFRPATKWATTVREADAIPEVVAMAFRIAREGVPGAVLIELPEDVAKEETTMTPVVAPCLVRATGTTTEALDQMLDLLAQAERPILLAGHGAMRVGCEAELAAFLDATGLYAATTFMGKGAVSDRHPRSLHCVGLGMRDIAIAAFEQADLVLTLGYHMIEWAPAKWNLGRRKKVVHIGVQRAVIDSDYLPDMELVGSLAATLSSLTSRLGDRHRKPEPYFEAVRQRIDDDLARDRRDDGFPVKPARILDDLRHVLDDDDILISDVGAHKMWVARQWPTYTGRTCFISNGFASMGGSLPGATEAKRLHPERKVVAVLGDAGFYMSAAALVPAVQLGTPFVAVVWADGEYGLIRWKQEMAFGRHAHTALALPDIAEVARAYGCRAQTLGATADLRPTLEAALAHTEGPPTILVVPVDYSVNMDLFHRLGTLTSH